MVDKSKLTENDMKALAFTEKDRRELARARSMPITFDEDCPEVTPEQAERFRRVNPARKEGS